MLQRNREIKTELTVFIVLTGLLTLFSSRIHCGLPVFLSCVVLGVFYFLFFFIATKFFLRKSLFLLTEKQWSFWGEKKHCSK